MAHKLDEMLLRWEELRREGRAVSVDYLCHDCPELREKLLAKIAVLEKMDRMLDLEEAAKPPAKAQILRTPYDNLKSSSEPVPGYRLEKKMGKGGFGEVWKAVGPGGFNVALKFVSLNGHLGAKEIQSLEILKTLRHPNLLATFGSWQVDGFLVLAMELADRTLLERLQEAISQGLVGIPRDELIGYMREAAKGIDYLNQPGQLLADSTKAGIQHRDIKPQNILLMGGSVKITDFGLMRVLKKTVTEHTGSMTMAYAPPEFFMGHTSRSSDQYSLAVTYCQLRGGRLPFAGTPGQIMKGHLEGRPDLTMLPEPERKPVERAMQKDHARRWPTCGDFVSSLASCIRHATLTGNVASPINRVSSSPWTRAFASRHFRLVGLITVICLTAALIWSLVPPGGQSKAAKSNAPGNELNSGMKDHASNPEHKSEKQTPVSKKTESEPNQGTWALSKGLELDLGGVKLKTVRIEPGAFSMGSPKSEKGRKADEYLHKVEITQPVFMGTHEVTRGQFRAFANAENYRTDAEKDGLGGWGFETETNRNAQKPGFSWLNVGFEQTDEHPVVNVTWNDAMAFCAWLTHKEGKVVDLPTEAEWEYACRAGTKTQFFSGNTEASMKGHGNVADRSFTKILPSTTIFNFDDGYTFTAPVGSFKPNAWGLHDMHGNVWEWCKDWYDKDYYKKSLRRDPQGPTYGDRRVLRGGSWDNGPKDCRAAIRNDTFLDDRGLGCGFRIVVRSLPKPP